MFLKNNLGIVSLAYVSHAGCQQTAEQMCFAMYHLDHLVSDIPLRKSWSSSQLMFCCCFALFFCPRRRKMIHALLPAQQGAGTWSGCCLNWQLFGTKSKALTTSMPLNPSIIKAYFYCLISPGHRNSLCQDCTNTCQTTVLAMLKKKHNKKKNKQHKTLCAIKWNWYSLGWKQMRATTGDTNMTFTDAAVQHA